MSDVLFIKTSSLGDVIHHMPALTEARRHRPGARFTWVVEEAYAPLVRLHPAVSEVMPVAWRRWRKALTEIATWREIAASRRAIRARRYDEIVDTQGLLRSALIVQAARGRKHGYDARSIREPLATLFYSARHRVSRDLHAIARNRILTGRALGYEPEGGPDYGLDRKRFRSGGARYAVLLHATARTEKEWPLEDWIALGRQFDVDLMLPGGTEAERQRAKHIAAALPRARVADKMSIDAVARLIAGAEFVVGVDTGLLHLAAAFAVPATGIYCASEPALTGPKGQGPIEIVGAKGMPPSVDDVAHAVERTRS
jgi:heptosyltransferase-1